MIDALTFDQLRVLITIVDTGSFSAAGRSLRRAQSSISAAIVNLESALNIQLFDRDGWKPELTEQGRALLPGIRVAMKCIESVKTQAEVLSNGCEPEISVAIDSMFPTKLVASIFSEFRKNFPMTSFRLYTAVLGGVQELVLAETCAMGIQGAVSVASGLISRSLKPIKLHPVASSHHPLAGKENVEFGELMEATQILMADSSGRTKGLTAGVFSSRQVFVADLSSKLALIREGVGWGYMPGELVDDEIDAGHLAVLNVGEAERSRTLPASLIYRENYIPGPAGRWLMNFLGIAP